MIKSDMSNNIHIQLLIIINKSIYSKQKTT